MFILEDNGDEDDGDDDDDDDDEGDDEDDEGDDEDDVVQTFCEMPTPHFVIFFGSQSNNSLVMGHSLTPNKKHTNQPVFFHHFSRGHRIWSRPVSPSLAQPTAIWWTPNCMKSDHGRLRCSHVQDGFLRDEHPNNQGSISRVSKTHE